MNFPSPRSGIGEEISRDPWSGREARVPAVVLWAIQRHHWMKMKTTFGSDASLDAADVAVAVDSTEESESSGWVARGSGTLEMVESSLFASPPPAPVVVVLLFRPLPMASFRPPPRLHRCGLYRRRCSDYWGGRQHSPLPRVRDPLAWVDFDCDCDGG